ncbi:TPA: integrase domain-containing protein [Salmonella enterica]
MDGVSRAGTKTPITDERYHEVLARLRIKDEGVAAVMRLLYGARMKRGNHLNTDR